MALRQTIMRDRRIEVVLDVIVDVVGKQDPVQIERDEVGARGPERRGRVVDGAVLHDGAQAQDRLQQRDQRQEPEQQIPAPETQIDRERGEAGIGERDQLALAAGGGAQRGRGVVEPAHALRLADEVVVVLDHRDAGQVLGQLAQEVAAAARIAGHQRQVGIERLVEVVVVDAVDGAVGEHRQAERRGAQLAGQVVEPARLEQAVVRAFVGEDGEPVLRAGDAGHRRHDDQGMPGVAARGDGGGDGRSGQREGLTDRPRGAPG